MKAYDAYYHANAKGTGSAVKFELHPAHDATAGAVFATFAQQKIDPVPDGVPMHFPRFDWDNALKVKFDRADLSQIIQVLRGMRESICDGKGLFHHFADSNTVIRFSHVIEPIPGYLFEVERRVGGAVERRIEFRFGYDEAFTFMLALERALLYVCFGVPEVERAEKAENRS